ncbi:MAG: hypothetical protein GF349_00965 [Candidatus Magasanikbacteria bacterium]|nr:hypothetical protein [Candidatus Magasanikbacteria bacterium]
MRDYTEMKLGASPSDLITLLKTLPSEKNVYKYVDIKGYSKRRKKYYIQIKKISVIERSEDFFPRPLPAIYLTLKVMLPKTWRETIIMRDLMPVGVDHFVFHILAQIESKEDAKKWLEELERKEEKK